MADELHPYEPLTSENAALVLVDHQVGLMTGVRDYSTGELKHNVVALAKAAKALKLPIVGPGNEGGAPRTQWRSLAERERGLSPEGEFPPGADEIGGTSRREFVQLLGATLAFAGASGCRCKGITTRKIKTILPKKQSVPNTASVYGAPIRFATPPAMSDPIGCTPINIVA